MMANHSCHNTPSAVSRHGLRPASAEPRRQYRISLFARILFVIHNPDSTSHQTSTNAHPPQSASSSTSAAAGTSSPPSDTAQPPEPP